MSNKIYKKYNKSDNINDYMDYIKNKFEEELNKYSDEDEYNEMLCLLNEWIIDYVGNMNLDITDDFLNNYGYRKALFYCVENYNLDTVYYLDKQKLLNNTLIINVLYNHIKSKLIIKQFNIKTH